MTMIMLVLVALLAMGGLIIYFAVAGESPTKIKKRRLIALRDRHSFSTGAVVAAQLRRIQANRATRIDNILTQLLPNTEQLTKRLSMTGRTWTHSQYLGACAAIGMVVTVSVYIKMFESAWAPAFALTAGMAVGLTIPHFVVNFLVKRRLRLFYVRFPDAIELLVRGLRSGLPISETLQLVASEVAGPVGQEFRTVVDKIKIGRTMDSALQDTADRLGTPEFQFFTITLQIQRETGGNLAETLSNLATVLRQRAQMKLKIKAMSSESKASAYIIGSLPFIVFFLIWQINPTYMMPFFSNPQLMIVGLGGMAWMGVGAWIMAKMISFEI